MTSAKRLLPALRLGLLALLAPALGCPEAGRVFEKVDAVALVNGAPITTDSFARELAYARRTSEGVFPQTDEQLAAFRRATLEDVINRTLVLAAAHTAGVAVPPERVDREILRLKAEYHGSSFDEALAEGQQSPQELRERTQIRLLIEKYFVDKVFAREAVTEAESAAFFKAHPEDFAQPEMVRAAQIVVKTQEEARKVQARVREGMGFDEAARRFSLSPDAKLGGDLGFFRRGTMPPVFDQTCFAMQRGQISEVVASEYGFHLFKILDRKAAEQRPLDAVRAEIERRLLRQKQDEAQQRTLKELRAKANIKIDEAALAKLPLGPAPQAPIGDPL